MSIIRKMRDEDADAVREIDALAFGAWLSQVRGEPVHLPQRTQANMLACWEKDPDGCFVAEEDGCAVGFIFSRTWGGVGWFGTFAVLPERQGCGIGKQLIAASLDYLRQDPHRVIGLETMPDSPYNLGLYLRQGFLACLPTLLLEKELASTDARGVSLPCWSSTETGMRERWLADLQEATGQIRPGLDYSKEIVSAVRHRLGETLVLADRSRAIGLSIAGLVSGREGWGVERASVQVLALHPDHTEDEAFRALLSASEALARAHGKRTLAVAANSRHAWALERLLSWGYRVERVVVRMVLKDTDRIPVRDSLVDLCRWAG